LLAGYATRMGRTCLDAFSTAVTFCAVGDHTIVNRRDGTSRTGIQASSALDAFLAMIDQDGLAALALGVAAPKATQWTSLEKNEGSNAGSVVKRVAFDIKNRRC